LGPEFFVVGIFVIEIERTYLAKDLPNLFGCKTKEIIDIYLPTNFPGHASIRIRKNGENYEITKKSRVNPESGSQLLEQTIILSKEEFDALEKEIKGRRVHKIRHYYPFEGRVAEIDVFQDKLIGLVIVEFEFGSEEELKEFKMPQFCLVDVTEEHFTRGGVLCGKSYSDLEKELNKFGYKKIIVKN
jgi:CYTH domain-containing protein